MERQVVRLSVNDKIPVECPWSLRFVTRIEQILPGIFNDVSEKIQIAL